MVQPVFNIISSEHTEGVISAVLVVNADSGIFEGHFPGQPVVPGACMLQTVKELLEDNFKAPVRLIKADNIKFLGLIQPGADSLALKINYQPSEVFIKITASLSTGEQVFMKLHGTFLAA